MSSTLISIVLIVRNEASRIGSLMRIIVEQAQSCPIEIVVVDGASSDATAAIVERFATSNSLVRLITLQDFGFGLQRNVGVNAAKGEFVLFLSADTTPSKLLVAKYISAAVAGNDVVQGTAIDWVSSAGAWPARLCDFRQWVYSRRGVGVAPVVEQFSTVNVMIRRSLLLQSAFDESLPALEDKAFAVTLPVRVRYERLRGAVVWHEYREALLAFCRRLFREGCALGRLAVEQRVAPPGSLDCFGWLSTTRNVLVTAASFAALGATALHGSGLAAIAGAIVGWCAACFSAPIRWTVKRVEGRAAWPQRAAAASLLTSSIVMGICAGLVVGVWRRHYRADALGLAVAIMAEAGGVGAYRGWRPAADP